MFNVCPDCGEYSDEKIIEAVDSCTSWAICPHCQFKHPFTMLPLLIVTGASGTGKTTVAMQLASEMEQCLCLESDILWNDAFNNPDDDYKQYRNLWLRMAKNISQAKRPVVLFGSSAPGQFEKCNESRYFSSIHYLAFVCSAPQLVQRLQRRPGWRKSGSAGAIETMIGFNQWLTDAAASNTNITLLDTTDLSIKESTAGTKSWILKNLSNSSPAAK